MGFRGWITCLALASAMPLLLGPVVGKAQLSTTKTLIVAEFRRDGSGMGSYSDLMAYQFHQGKLTSRIPLFGAPTVKENVPGSYVRFDLGTNFIYKNRYVVSGIGNVIDLKTRSLVMEDSDDFIEAEGDRLIFHRDNVDTGTGYLALDLNTRHYGWVGDKNFRAVQGIQSPDHIHGIASDGLTFAPATRAEYLRDQPARPNLPNRIMLYNAHQGPTMMVEDCGRGTSLRGASEFPRVPMLWLNNSEFVYANYRDSSASVRVVNITIRSEEVVGTIQPMPTAFSNARFEWDGQGNLILECARGAFRVDWKNRAVLPAPYRVLENQFQIARTQKPSGREILYQNKPIGRLWCTDYSAKTTEGYLAVEYGQPGSNLGYPKGVKVWSSASHQWTTLDIPWVSAIIGWTDDDEQGRSPAG